MKRSHLEGLTLVFAIGAMTGLGGCSETPEGVRELPAEISRVEPATAEYDPTSITVMSWNVKGSGVRSDPDHLEKIAAMIRQLSPDIVMLQEVHRHTRAAGGQDQFEILSRTLRMSGCFGESLRIRDTGSYGNAILTTATITSGRTLLLPGRGEPRTVLECETRWNNLEIPVMTTHLTAWDRANRRTRALQTNAIEDLLESNGSPLLLLGGDFNAPLSSPEMVRLAVGTFARPLITDYVVTHPGTGRSYDHLFAGDGWSVDDARIIQQGPSDHWPIFSRLSTPAAGDEQ